MKFIILVIAIICIGFVSTFSIVKVGDASEDCVSKKCTSLHNSCKRDTKCSTAVHTCLDKCGKTPSYCWNICLASQNVQGATDLIKCAAYYSCQ